jgi:hypothetical protein
MSEDLEPSGHPFLKRLLSPWGIAAAILAIFFLGEIYLAWRDRAAQAALEDFPPFTTPAFDLAFSKKIPYDPLSFVGKGAQTGYWQWSPDGLILTEQGRKFFEESGEMFVSKAPAGKRRLQRIRINQGTKDGDRQLDFIYQWVEVSPVAAVLLVHPPLLNEEYPGQAILTRQGGSWKVKSLRTQDFEDSMGHLKAAASGVLK